MPVGGKRPGAGRPKGSPNRRTADLSRKLDELEDELGKDTDPAMHLARVIADDSAAPDLRIQAAKDLLPYVYPRLGSIDVNTNVNVTDGLAERLRRAKARLADAGDE